MDNNIPNSPQSQRTPDNSYLPPPANAEANVIVSEDEQTAYLGIKAPVNGGKDLTYDMLIAELEKKRVTNGVLTDTLKELAATPKYNSMVLVAQGIAPVQGEDAKLTFHFSYNRDIKPKERSDGTVDYHDLGLIEQVVEGQPLVTLTPAVKGVQGKTVTGRVILPAQVRNLALPLGKNTKFSDDRLQLLAAKTGSVEFQGGKVNVYDVFTLNGDVCNATGNVNFDGSVIVNGDVLTGFSVTATGNINIVGNVEGAMLDAGGDIKIAAGLVGQGKGYAKCGGNFKALFVENAEIFAKGDVSADVFMQSRVKCGGSLIADGKRGAIIGGAYIVGRDVKAVTIGAPSGVQTVFELGIDPTLNERMKNINESIRMLGNELVKLNQIIQLLSPLQAAGKLPPERADMLEKAIATKANDDVQMAELTSEHESLTAVSNMPAASQLVCKKDLFYGTKVLISSVPYLVPSDLVRCRLYLNPAREVTLVSV